MNFKGKKSVYDWLPIFTFGILDRELGFWVKLGYDVFEFCLDWVRIWIHLFNLVWDWVYLKIDPSHFKLHPHEQTQMA